MWSGIVNAARLVRDVFVGFANLIRRRPFRDGTAPWQFMPMFDTLKVLVIVAVIAGIFVVVGGGGSYGGGGARSRTGSPVTPEDPRNLSF